MKTPPAPKTDRRAFRLKMTGIIAENRARDLAAAGKTEVSRASIEARAAVECDREPWLVRPNYVTKLVRALRRRGVAIVA